MAMAIRGTELEHGGAVPITNMLALAGVMLGLCVVLTCGRFVLRWHKLRKLQWDDFLNGLAAVLVVPYIAICIVILPYQYEAQQYVLGLRDTPPKTLSPGHEVRYSLALIILLWLIMYTVKASFLALYWYLFEVSARFRMAWWTTVTVVALSFGITIVSIFWHCGSPANILNDEACNEVPEGRVVILLCLWCALNVLGGILLMALPIIMVTSRMLSLEPLQRLGLVLVFALVFFDMAFDIIRTVFSLSSSLSVHTNLSGVWTILEPTVAVIVCTLPHYRSLLSRKPHRSSSEIKPTHFTFTKMGRSPHMITPGELDDASAYSLPSRLHVDTPV